MAKLSMGLRTRDVDTTQRSGGGRIPDGLYEFEVDEVSTKDHWDKRSGYELSITLEITAPEAFKGRKVFLDCNVEDPDGEPDWEKWGREALARLLRATDWPEDDEFEDTDDLVGRTGIVKVGLDEKRSKSQGKPFTRVWGWVYPEDADDAELGPFETQTEFKADSQERQERGGRDRGSERRGGSDRGSSRGSSRGGRDEEREERGSRGGRDREDSDRSRSRDREDRGSRDRGREDSRGAEDDDIPFNEERGGDDKGSRRGGGSNPWNRGRS